MNEALTVGVYIGRFQPFHNGHLATLRSALDRFDRVVVVIGSARECLTERNPWSADQRAAMILDALTLPERHRVWITAQPDMPDDNAAWALSIQEKVTFLKKVAKMNGAGTFVTGFQKPDTEYLRYFPWWQFRPSEQYVDTSATEIRKEYFSPEISGISFFEKVPTSVAGFLLAYQSTWGYSYMVTEILTKGM